MKYYAVRKGKSTGIFTTWKECSEQVIGVKDAEYKSFQTEEEAIRYLKEGVPFSANKSYDKLAENEMVCYVDGSFNEKTNTCGYGIISFTDMGKQEDAAVVPIHGMEQYRNVTGEVFGSLTAMKNAIHEGKTELYLHYDYTGIRHWALGEWKRNNELTEWYHDQYQALKDQLTVHFIKVKGHTGDLYNERADQLAKEAVGLQQKN